VRIVQLVPTLPPPLEGVGTHAFALAVHSAIECTAVLAAPGWAGEVY
jgi:hypothetical protein